MSCLQSAGVLTIYHPQVYSGQPSPKGPNQELDTQSIVLRGCCLQRVTTLLHAHALTHTDSVPPAHTSMTVSTHIFKSTAPEELLHVSPVGEGVPVLGEELQDLRVEAEVMGSPRELLKETVE